LARYINDDPSSQEDTRLALLMKAGDESAFRLLYDKHYNWVYSKIYRMLSNHQDTEEVCADIFFKVWRKIDKWDTDQGSFQAWLNVVAKHTIIDAIRKKERIRESLLSMEDESDVPLSEYEDSKPTPDKQLEAQEAQEILDQALQQVTKPNHRVAWVLRHIEGGSIAEISQGLQRKEGTVKIWIFRCTQELRQILSRKGIKWVY
jgi:RNA polymerase sigma-70 factor (ECF subfamily)